METPDGLHELEYARHILEEVLGWPAKGNVELIADCIRSISISRKLTLIQAHAYLQRAIRLAREQLIPVSKFFFLDGVYTEVRPERRELGQGQPATCETCGGERMLHQAARVPGPRLVACPDCNPNSASRQVGLYSPAPEKPERGECISVA